MRDLSLLIARHKSYFESLNYYCESSHCTLDMEALEIRDVWGNKFDFYINESGEYTLLSNGQNGVSENGNGDDIVNSFSVPMLK